MEGLVRAEVLHGLGDKFKESSEFKPTFCPKDFLLSIYLNSAILECESRKGKLEGIKQPRLGKYIMFSC